MPKDVMCKNCNNLKHDWCDKRIDSPDPNMERDCPYFWERTNADRIRAMTDEELAHELALVAGWDREQYKKAKRIGIEKIILDILRQPCEED